MKKTLFLIPLVALAMAACTPTSVDPSTTTPDPTTPDPTTPVTDVSTIKEVRAAGESSAKKMIEGRVVGVNSSNVVVEDATGTIVVFAPNHESGVAVGDHVKVTGTTEKYRDVLQFTDITSAYTDPVVIEKLTTTAPDSSLTAEPLTNADLKADLGTLAGTIETDGYLPFFSATVKVVSDGTYINTFIVDGETTGDVQIRSFILDGCDNFTVAANADKMYTVEGFITGVQSSYIGVLYSSATAVDGGGTEEPVDPPVGNEKAITLTSTGLGLINSYADGTGKVVNGATFGLTQVADYGDGIQVRNKNGVPSAIFNEVLFTSAIDSIEFNLSASKHGEGNTTYTPNLFGVTLGTTLLDDTNATEMAVTGVLHQLSYTYDVDETAGYKSIRMNQVATYTTYYESIVINLV